MTLPLSWNVRKAVAATLLASGALAPRAQAQLLNQFLPGAVFGRADEADVTVESRARTGYEQRGVRVGSVSIRPVVTESFGYESNVLGLPNARGSKVLSTNANLDAVLENSRGSVSTGLSVSDSRYFDLPNQSFTNWNASLGGTYNFGRDTASVIVLHQNLYQTQRDLDTPQLSEPTPITFDTVRLGYRANLSRISLTPSLEVSRYRYDSGVSGTAIYDQSYRNRTVITPGVVAAYEFATRRSAVLVVRNAIATFSTGTPTSPKRNFNDTSVLAGVDYDLTGILRARALAGYETRSFSSKTYQTIQAPIAELSLIYTPTGLTTITATVARRIQDSADETTAGVTSLSAALRIDHELRRNVLLTAGAGVSQNDYSVGGGQTLYTGNLGATYLLNRNAAVAATYDVLARTSSTTALNLSGFSVGANYIDHRVLLQLKLSL